MARSNMPTKADIRHADVEACEARLLAALSRNMNLRAGLRRVREILDKPTDSHGECQFMISHAMAAIDAILHKSERG
jgi:hypothetical protein